MTTSITGSKFRAWDSHTGMPLSFGRVYIYRTGTNIPIESWRTPDKAEKNPWPVGLNGAGYADIVIGETAKIVVKDREGVEVHTTDPVNLVIDESQVGVKRQNIALSYPANEIVSGEDGELYVSRKQTSGVKAEEDDGTSWLPVLQKRAQGITGLVNLPYVNLPDGLKISVEMKGREPSVFERQVSLDDEKAEVGRIVCSGKSLFVHDSKNRAFKFLPKTFDAFDLGAVGFGEGDSLDGVLPEVAKFCMANKITRLVVPHDCTIQGNIEIKLTGNLDISGPVGSNIGVTVVHSGNNSALILSGVGLFTSGKTSNLRIIGNNGDKARWVEHRDSWSHSDENLFITGYSNTRPILLHNYERWTENFSAKSIMSRGNKGLIEFKRTAEKGGTSSFFGFSMEDCWHQFVRPNSIAIVVPDSREGQEIKIYGSRKVELGGWLESGGGHRVMFIGDNNIFDDSKMRVTLDGLGNNNARDFFIMRASERALVDISLENHSGQGTEYDVTEFENIDIVRHLIELDNRFNARGSRPVANLRGARIGFVVNNVDSNIVKTFRFMPLFTQWRLTLSVFGAHVEFTETYIISVGSANFVPRVVSQSVPSSSTRDTADANFFVQAAGGGSGGQFVEGGGGRFALVLNAEDQAAIRPDEEQGSYDVHGVLEML